MSILGNLFLRGGADKSIAIPTLLKQGALLIDTRAPDEFSGGHIEGAINIPYDIIGGVISKYETDTSRPIIVYCHSGMRSAAAQKTLQQAGYSHVINGGGLHHMQKVLES